MSPVASDINAPPVLGPESAGVLMTPEEFDEVTEYDDGFRYELIRGVLVVTPILAEAEASPNDELGAMLRQYQREHPQGAALDETLPELYQTPLLPDFELPLARLLAVADRWA